MESLEAGRLRLFQEINRDLFGADGHVGFKWQMSIPERCALVQIARTRQPGVAIEIGTASGGSLSILSHYAGKVYSLDIDPSCRDRLGRHFPNVEFLTGPSHETLPPLLARLDAEGADLGVALIDGDHTEAGVRSDIEAFLVHRWRQTLFLLMHDSYNPDCRRGMETAHWAANPRVHYVELDFVWGTLCGIPPYTGEMWGGLGLAYFKTEDRTGSVAFSKYLSTAWDIIFEHCSNLQTARLSSSTA